MSTAAHERVPALTLGWRLKMALDHGGVSRDEMARELGKTPGTLSRWMSDTGAPPARAYVALWAQITHVPLSWLEHGVVVEDPEPGEPAPEHHDAVARLAERKRRATRGLDIGR